ncbi:MAG TPA: F0F1 ATP synthase subunit A [Kofleriaceae bacterium]|nr:F0F1 ATP synthase subunit A [Kofleriaceae bacterium]
MGEHGTWTDLLYRLPGWRNLHDYLGGHLGREKQALVFADSHFTLTHVLWTILVALFVTVGCIRFRASVAGANGLLPAEKFGFRAFFEMVADATYGTMVQIMGEKNARRYLPLIGGLAMFILFSNLLALIPGAGVPTTTLKTNVALAVLVFVLTHVYGVRENGLGYFKHFLGPVLWLAPLMVVIEIISHVARPISLSLRLMGNMVADHKVVFTFFTLFPLILPVPFLFLGLLVAFVQTFVFCVLTMIYIALATAHDH